MAYKLGAVKPHVESAAHEIGNLFGIKNIGGWRRFGSVPGSDHPKGLALDFMTWNKKTHDGITAYVIANASRLGVTYIISWGKIWKASTGEWDTYIGPSPHLDHVHVSFGANAGTGGEVKTPEKGGGFSIPILGEIEESAARLRDPLFWRRVGTYALGGALIFVGIQTLIREPVEALTTEIVKAVK